MTLEIFEYLEKYDYEQVVFCQDKESGLKAIIAIHDTTLGPALGGTECGHMILKKRRLKMHCVCKRDDIQNAAAGLNLGGAKQ